MFCKFCGNELPNDANFCTKCGKVVIQEENESVESLITEFPDEQEPSVIEDPEKDELGGKILKFSILGLAFACSFFLSLLGLIFSIISKSLVNNYKEMYGETEGRATVGKHLGIAGLIASIVMLVLFAVYVVVVVAAVLFALSA